MNVPFFILPIPLMRVKQIKLTAKIVYRYLVFKQANRGHWNGWMKQISNETGIFSTRRVAGALKQLSSIGYIKYKRTKQRSIDGKIRTFTRYHVIELPDTKTIQYSVDTTKE